MTKVFVAMVLSLMAVGCVSRPQYDGSQWPWNQEDKEFHAKLRAMADSARSGNDASLRDLFWIGLVLDTERSDYYDWVLQSVYRKRDLVEFARVLSREPAYVRIDVLVALRDALKDDELRTLLTSTNVDLDSLE